MPNDGEIGGEFHYAVQKTIGDWFIYRTDGKLVTVRSDEAEAVGLIGLLDETARHFIVPTAPPQPDPSELILEYVEAKNEEAAASAEGYEIENYARREAAYKRVAAAAQALFDFADSRKGE